MSPNEGRFGAATNFDLDLDFVLAFALDLTAIFWPLRALAGLFLTCCRAESVFEPRADS